MGSNVAPSYANLYMAFLEDTFTYSSHHSRFILGWWRFIDDIFVVWTGSAYQLSLFHAFLNQIDSSIQFTLTFSAEKIQFLDTEISIENGRLHTKLYVKSTDKNTLLQFKSCHPQKMVKSLPFSQMLRVRRIVDREGKVDSAFADMVKKFREQGYPNNLVEYHKNRVKSLSQVESFRPKTRTTSNRIPFVTT